MFSAENGIPPGFHPDFGVFLLYYIADVGAPRSEDPALITGVFTFELRPRYINVTDRRTDGRLTLAIPRNAYSASRRENVGTSYYIQLLRVSLYKV